MINAKTYRKFECAAGMKFVHIVHKGHWGNWADCACEDGTVWNVNKKTGEKKIDPFWSYADGSIYHMFQKREQND